MADEMQLHLRLRCVHTLPENTLIGGGENLSWFHLVREAQVRVLLWNRLITDLNKGLK